MAVFSAATAVPLWLVEFAPLQDLPNHALKVNIVERLLAGDEQAAAVFRLNLRPIPNATLYAFLLLCAPALDPVAASRVFATLVLLGVPLVGWWALERVKPGAGLLALAVPPIGPSLFFEKGTLNFCAALGLFVAGLAATQTPPERRPLLWMTILGTALYFTHGFAFGVFAVVLSVACVSGRAPRLLLATLLPGMLLFGANLALEASSARGAAGLRPQFAAFHWPSIADGVSWLFPGGRPGVLAATFWAAGMLACASATAVRLLRGRPRLGEVLTAAPTLVALIYVAAPSGLQDWAHLRHRLLPLLFLSLLLALDLPTGRGARAAVLLCFGASTAVVVVRQAKEYPLASRAISQYVAATALLPPGASLLALDREPSGYRVRPNLHSWAYYHLRQGGWGPYVHAYPSYHPVVYRSAPWAPDEAIGSARLGELGERAAACYHYLVVWQPLPEDRDDLDTHFTWIVADDTILVGRSRGAAPPPRDPRCRMPS